MPLFFLAFIGMMLMVVFFFKLSQLPPSVIILSVKWTGLAVLLASFVLFILSGRTIPATLLVVFFGVAWAMSRKKPAPPAKRISWKGTE